MWASLKSDLEEFVSGAAEETSAVATKVTGGRLTDDDPLLSSSLSSMATSVTNSVTISSVASRTNKEGWSVKGLSSMLGGVVESASYVAAPLASSATAATAAAAAPAPVPPPALAPVSASVASMLEEEEELGWDDDEEDDFFAEDLNSPSDNLSNNTPNNTSDNLSNNTPNSPNTESDETNEALSALQLKLSRVEQERDTLQAEHRAQTAQLVELRAKVEELSNPTASTDVAMLQQQVDELTLQLQQSGDLSTELKVYQQEKTHLEQQLQALQLDNDQIRSDSTSRESEKQTQIDKLTDELNNLQLQLESANEELTEVKQHLQQQQQQQSQQESQLKQQLEEWKTKYETAMESLQDHEHKLQLLQQEKDNLADSNKQVEAAAAAPISPRLMVDLDDVEDDWGDGDWGDEE